jgi:neuroligin
LFKSQSRPSQVYGSIHGEELAYVLGMPLTGGSFHLQLNYTRQEQILAEIIMTYWISFAKTG